MKDAMSCDDAQLLMQSYIDGDLLAAQREDLEAHIEGCPLCRHLVTSLQALDLRLAGLGSAPPSVDLAARVMAALPRDPLSRRLLRAVVRGHGAVVVALFVLTLSAGLLSAYRFGRFSSDPSFREVEVVFVDPGARSVTLVGDFNQWDPKGIPMRRSAGNETWRARVKLPAGIYHYNFLVDDTDWVADPDSAAQISDGFGGKTSVLLVEG